MTVELERPFVWPEPVEDLSPWNQKEVQESEKEQQQMQKMASPTGDAEVHVERRERMREQAKALLEGRERWRPAKTGGGMGSAANRW